MVEDGGPRLEDPVIQDHPIADRHRLLCLAAKGVAEPKLGLASVRVRLNLCDLKDELARIAIDEIPAIAPQSQQEPSVTLRPVSFLLFNKDLQKDVKTIHGEIGA